MREVHNLNLSHRVLYLTDLMAFPVCLQESEFLLGSQPPPSKPLHAIVFPSHLYAEYL